MLNSFRRHLALVALLALAGCAPLASVKTIRPQFARADLSTQQLIGAGQRLDAAEKLKRREPLAALGEYLAAAQAAADVLRREPANAPARNTYNYAVARCLEIIQDANLNPWDRPLAVPGGFVLSARLKPGPERHPSNYTLIAADTIEVGGTYFKHRVVVEGVGAPFVAVGRSEMRDFRTKFAPKRLYAGVTAVIRFSGTRAEIQFLEPLATDRVTMNGRSYPLAADFSAPLAKNLAGERPDKLGLVRLLRPERYADTARLSRLQTYDPNRIPVIFTHGLQDTPASWAPMINELRDDPEIRRRYQFWVFSYPSGYPYPYSGVLMRRELDAVHRAFPDHKPVVLVGHSMGSLVSRLMVTDAGDKIWISYFGKPPAETKLAGSSRALLEEAAIFNHWPGVGRVIFISAPHRGSLLASNWIGRTASRLVHAPHFLADLKNAVISLVTVDSASMKLQGIPNSIDTLAPNNRFVREINKFPIAPGIPYHSIMGDRGKGGNRDKTPPFSSDGVVPYWSSHLDRAESELIVPSNHSAHQNPKAIAEVRRILRAHH